MMTLPLHWEMAFLLIALPIYVLAMAVTIVQQMPLPLRNLSKGEDSSLNSDKKLNIGHLAQGMLFTGILLHSIAIIMRGLRAGHVPLTNIYESFIFFSWAIMVATLVISIVRRVFAISLGTIPIAVILMIIALINVRDVEPLAPILRTYWLTIHAGFSFLSYAAYTVACIAGILYLFQEREIKHKKFGFLSRFLPPLESLDQLNYFSIILGFVLLTIGIVTGAIWSKQVHGFYWQGDSKEVLSIITWVLYALLVQIRLISKWRGRKVAYLSILCFGFVILTFVGSGLFIPGWHSFLIKPQ